MSIRSMASSGAPESFGSEPVFVWDTLPASLYRTIALLPSGCIFVTASERAAVLDPATAYRAVHTFLVQGSGTAANTYMGFAKNNAFRPIPGAAPLSTTVAASTTRSLVIDGQFPTRPAPTETSLNENECRHGG
ncbi:hypothetical protein HDU96_006473 [Phlyctochytrium bullatum]|nr:hypothetical protein HDU96_006473 [Phlyctochytrium bullatum]